MAQDKDQQIIVYNMRIKEIFMKHRSKSVIGAAFILMLGSSGLFLASCSEGDKSSSKPQPTETAETGAKTEPFEADGMRFSAVSGFYDEEFYLDITADDSCNVYYTLDGSVPSVESQRFTQPVLISDRSAEKNVLSAHKDIAQPANFVKYDLPDSPVDKATVVRAIAVDGSGSQSRVVSCTYFVGFREKADYYDDVKTISLITEESSLFDYENGIYTIGKTYDDWFESDEYDPETPDWFLPANYTQKGREWEREAFVQFFEGGKLAYSQDVGIRIHGGASRSYTQKSLNIYARKDYGAPKLVYDLFSGNVVSQHSNAPVTEFDSFMLRNCGNDAMYTRFRDKLIQSLVSDRQFLTQGMEPCILFINGEYWGHYEITEKLDAAFVKAHYGVPKKDVCIIKKDLLEEGSEEVFAEWEKLRKWINETDFSDDAAYKKLCEFVDMKGFMDYVSTELYIDNCDWGAQNSAMWRVQTIDKSNPYADGKWRFILFDTEYSTGIYHEALADNDTLSSLMEEDCFITDLFKAAMKNEGFKQSFMDTFEDISNNNFSDERVENEIDRISETYHDMVTDTYDRFWHISFGGSAGEYSYDEAVGELRSFFSERRKYITDYVQKYSKE